MNCCCCCCCHHFGERNRTEKKKLKESRKEDETCTNSLFKISHCCSKSHLKMASPSHSSRKSKHRSVIIQSPRFGNYGYFPLLLEFVLLIFLLCSSNVAYAIVLISNWHQFILFLTICWALMVMHISDHLPLVSARYGNLLFRKTGASQGILLAITMGHFVYSQQAIVCGMSTKHQASNASSSHLLIIYTRTIWAFSCSMFVFGCFYMLQIGSAFISLIMIFSCYFLQNHITDLTVILPSINVLVYFGLFWSLNYFCPQSFTIGESSILCQAAVMLLMDFFVIFVQRTELSIFAACKNLLEVTNRSQTYAFISSLLVSFFIISLVLSPVFHCLAYHTKSQKDNIIFSIGFYIGGILNVAAIFIPIANTALDSNLFTFLLSLINYKSIILTIYWMCCLALSIVIVVWHADFNNRANFIPNIIARKLFHFIAVLIYLPGIYFYPDWIRVSSSLAVVLLVILEYIRIFKIYPASSLLERYMISFIDERDQGSIILTHIYLLLGFSIPVWIFPFETTSSLYCLVPYAGLLSLGFGDAFASIFGTLYGKVKLPGTKKTIVGTFACIFSQFFAALFILLLYNRHISLIETFHLFIGIVFVSFMEAVTSQIDNLILPLFLYAILVQVV